MRSECLQVFISDNPHFHTLYSDGQEITMVKNNEASVLLYPTDAVIFLYYTYPTHRRVYCVRYKDSQSMVELPDLSDKVTILFKQYASRVDKTKRAVSFLREHYPEYAYSFSDGFYHRLDVILLKKGSLDYYELGELCIRSITNGCTRYA